MVISGVARLSLIAVVAVAGIASTPTVVKAECFPVLSLPVKSFIGHAFTATVRDITGRNDALDPQGRTWTFDYEVVLDVGRVFRGKVPERLEIRGWGVGCDMLNARFLREGDRVFVTADRIDRYPYLFGDFMLWRRSEDGWRFPRPLHPRDPSAYPQAARSATTFRQVRALAGAERPAHKPTPVKTIPSEQAPAPRPALAGDPEPSGPPDAVAVAAASFPRCADVTQIAADPSLYRDAPLYVANEMPTEEVLRWARTQPGFEELWIDRDHLGWVTVGFSQDADARQADIERLFPDDGVVAVAVEHTRNELRWLQHRVTAALPAVSDSFSVGASVNRGVVDVGVGALTDEVLSLLEEEFSGAPICVDGRDPSTLPSPGPQPQAGEGWRLLGAERGVGLTYRTGIATDAKDLARLWKQSGLPGEPPAVDFEREVAIWFGHVYGGSCPNQRLDDVVVDEARALLYPLIVDPDAPLFCTDDAHPYAFVVAVGRAALPAGPFTIQLDADDPPAGAPRERTVVDVDLSRPGAVAGPGDVHHDRKHRAENVLESGGVMEPGFPRPYRFDVSCGIDWLGEVNDIDWRVDLVGDEATGIPEAWQPLVEADGTLGVSLLLLVEPEPRIEVTANGHTVGYLPSTEPPPDCPAS